MIISPSRKFVFVHLPKTGGTAFTLAYEDIARRDDLLFGDTPKAQRRQRGFHRRTGKRLGKHATVTQAAEVLPDLNLSRFTVATIVRNPWDRMVSFYAWGRAQSFDHPMIEAAKALPFGEFLQDPRVTRSFTAHPTQSYLTLAADTLPPHILRHERLAQDCTDLTEVLGRPLPPLQRVNSSEREEDYRRAYTDATAALIPPLFPFETGALGYAF